MRYRGLGGFGDLRGLRSVERIEHGPDDAPWHVVINGENFHALQALRSTHRGKVDLIYIDPPYNTGNDGWIYSDRYVDQTDRAKSSKWLSFMERRLLIARDLLKPTGVLIAAIGDDEHHRLRMLLDQVFETQNFIVNVAWQGGVSALSRHHGGGLDYMLIYGRDATQVGQFLDPKPLAPEMLRVARDAVRSGKSAHEAQQLLREFIRTEGKDLPPGVRRFNHVDDAGEVYPIAVVVEYGCESNTVTRSSSPKVSRRSADHFLATPSGWGASVPSHFPVPIQCS